MKINAEIIKDSINEYGVRITSFILTYPRFIHAEMLTHRVFSRNAASSRAIPINKMIDDVIANTAIPIHWGKNQKGMQAESEIDEGDIGKCIEIWTKARDNAIEQARELVKLNVHKQVVNRLLEPFMFIRVLLTGTEFNNFFELRSHKAAQPEIDALATMMKDLYERNKPQLLKFEEWHIPFSDRMPEGIDFKTQLKIATARAARLSYNNFLGEIDVDKDVVLHDDLLQSKHMSPFEHCARVESRKWYDNFFSWKSYRNILNHGRR